MKNNITKAVKLGGIAPCTHGNTRKLPYNTLTLNVVQGVICFLLNYREKHALLLPGRVPGYSQGSSHPVRPEEVFGIFIKRQQSRGKQALSLLTLHSVCYGRLSYLMSF